MVNFVSYTDAFLLQIQDAGYKFSPAPFSSKLKRVKGPNQEGKKGSIDRKEMQLWQSRNLLLFSCQMSSLTWFDAEDHPDSKPPYFRKWHSKLTRKANQCKHALKPDFLSPIILRECMQNLCNTMIYHSSSEERPNSGIDWPTKKYLSTIGKPQLENIWSNGSNYSAFLKSRDKN